jgi:tetraacyldisaccharide 4'-kinase
VPLNEPGWWYAEEPGTLARLLAPVARLYGNLAERRFRRCQPYRSRYPVICVGNFTAGGTGKTPLAIHIARLLQAHGAKPVFLTRGYGGRERGPEWVENTAGAAWRFGDEPLLLAGIAPTVVARDRKSGVRMIENSGRSVSAVIMDDGLQNPALVKDLSIAVVDGRRGLGNGEVIPAGPLRARLTFQVGLVDAILVREPRGDDYDDTNRAEHDIHRLLRHAFPGPVLAARAVARDDTAWLAGAKVVAFAGIANPERFFALAESLGAHVAARVAFADHHRFTRADAERLVRLAQENEALLVTTEKDWVRLTGDDKPHEDLLQRTRPLGIELALDARNSKRLASLVETAALNQSYPRRTSRPPRL